MDPVLQLPIGFYFRPTDEELMQELYRKCTLQLITSPIKEEVDLYRFNPWDFPKIAMCKEGDFYFFSPLDKNCPNGSRLHRVAGYGFWKVVGAEKLVGHRGAFGIKRTMVFCVGNAPNGQKTDWIMHEYTLPDSYHCGQRNNISRLGEWVLVHIYSEKIITGAYRGQTHFQAAQRRHLNLSSRL